MIEEKGRKGRGGRKRQHKHRHEPKNKRSMHKYHRHDEFGNDILRLSDIPPGDEVVIAKVPGHGAFRKRITEMGFVRGKKVKVIKNAPLLDPVEYEIMGYNISLRRSEADLIEVVEIDEEAQIIGNFAGTLQEGSVYPVKQKADKIINIALVGNPNCGKTSLFNRFSGSREKVGNYSGVTVESKEAHVSFGGYRLNISDLPGTYSITEYTPEELYVRTHIVEKTPDIVINVIDASNPERNLFLTTQLIDMNIRVVAALNMYDELVTSGAEFDYRHLGRMLGMPFVPTVGSKGKGVKELFEKVIEVYENREPTVRNVKINYGNEIESAIEEIKPLIEKNRHITAKYDPRYLSIKMLEGDQTTKEIFGSCENCPLIKEKTSEKQEIIEKKFKDTSENIITDAKYGFIAGALKETYILPEEEAAKKIKNRRIDNILTHRIWGFPVFLLFLWLTFQSTFTFGSYPMDWIDSMVASISGFLQNNMSDSIFKDLLVDGIIGGVGSVIIFLPNIVILFFCISLMEDTGYMARASFIMDKLMHKIGLHGHSFIPLIMGFGCNVPAIMATRRLENRNDRILTMLIIPFMSCSARLPVYVLLIGAFFSNYAATVLFGVYLFGIMTAIVSALIFKKVFFAKEEAPFVMELPPYRVPTIRNILSHTWDKAVEYLKKMGGIILIASVIIWVLGYFPRNPEFERDYASEIKKIENAEDLSDKQVKNKIEDIEIDREAERQKKSYIGRLGTFIRPVFAPMQFDEKISVSLLTGLPAKEIIVSSMGVLYRSEARKLGQTEEGAPATAPGYNELAEEDETAGLTYALKQQGFSISTALALLVFILIYFPCVAVIAAIKREGGTSWAVFTVFYTTGLAWILSFFVYYASEFIGKIF